MQGAPRRTIRQPVIVMAGGYDAARPRFHLDRPALGSLGSGTYHDMGDRQNLLKMSRYLFSNNYLYAAIIRSAVATLIGGEDVFNIQIRSAQTGFSDTYERLLGDWINGAPESRGLLRGVDLFRRICAEFLITGEAFLLKLPRGQIQIIEPELVGGLAQADGFVDGVMLQGDRIAKYAIGRYTSAGLPDHSNPQIVDARQMIHIYDNPRISGVRGVPPLQSAFDLMFRVGSIVEAEAVSWEVISRIALIATKKGGAELADFASDSKRTDDGHIIEDWGIAQIFHADVDEDLRSMDRNVPSKNFGDVLLEFIRLLAAPLGLPAEFVNCNFTKSNYSQSKAATLFAFRNLQHWQSLMRGLIEQIVTWRIMLWEPNPPDFRVDVYLPRALRLDEDKEVTATERKIANCLTTLTEAASEVGWDFEELLRARRQEIIRAIEMSRSIEAETGEKVPWQIFAGLGKIAGSPRTVGEQKEIEDDAP